MRLLNNILKFFEGVQEGFKSKSVEFIRVEKRELENVFSLLLFGSYIGMPAPPTFLSLELLPYVARELYVLGTTAERSDDPLGQIAEFFEI
jgi:hypothetical protein